MKIVRYTPKVQEQLKSETEPQPWLHAIVAAKPNTKGMCDYAIYVWDTRQIVEVDTVKLLSPLEGTAGKDSRLPLKGSKAKEFNDLLLDGSSTVDGTWSVIRMGGSIKDEATHKFGSRPVHIASKDISEDDAKEFAKRSNERKVIGEKSDYKITYKAVKTAQLKKIED